MGHVTLCNYTVNIKITLLYANIVLTPTVCAGKVSASYSKNFLSYSPAK